MNRIFGIMLSAALLCGSAGAAMATTTTTTDANCEAQLHAQVQALQAQVAALQASSDVQSASASGYQMPTGG
jgi:uncharacterized protein YceH (UPF0502 family)